MTATARIDMRCEETEKDLLNRAAAIKGMRTSEFIRELALEQAREVIDEAERIVVSERSYREILDLLDNPPEPSDTLIGAMRKHQATGL